MQNNFYHLKKRNFLNQHFSWSLEKGNYMYKINLIYSMKILHKTDFKMYDKS